MKPKICATCGNQFMPFNTTHRVCSPGCAIEFARNKAKQSFKRKTRKEVKKLNDGDRSIQLKKAQAAFNAYVRERDSREGCISCGKINDSKQFHAGHYQSTGAHPELRFHPFNNHKQCAPCNNHLSGNIVNYRPRLISKIGQKAIDWLESTSSTYKLTLDDIKEIRQFYKQQLKILKEMDSFERWSDGL